VPIREYFGGSHGLSSLLPGWSVRDSVTNFIRGVHDNQNVNSGRWYHENLRRHPGVHTCATNDQACIYEAEMQYIRDRDVDRHIVNILEERLRMCWTMHGNEFMKSSFDVDACSDIAMYKRQADMNYNTKYRQLYKWGIQSTKALMKQKNRIIEERWLERQGKSYAEIQNMIQEPLTQQFITDMAKWS